MSKLVDSVQDAAYTVAGLQILSFDKVRAVVNDRFSVDEAVAKARTKGQPAFDQLTKLVSTVGKPFNGTD
jgi:hypothetical protein